MTPLDVRDAALTAIQAYLPDLLTCKPYPGSMNIDELDRWFVDMPAVRVAFLGVDGVEPEASGMVDCTCTYTAFVAAKTQEQQSLASGDVAANIATALIPLIDRNDWGLDDVLGAAVLRAENLYSPGVDTLGLALWSVTWTHVARLGASAFAGADGIVLNHLYVAQAPAIGADNIGAYVDVLTGEAPNV